MSQTPIRSNADVDPLTVIDENAADWRKRRARYQRAANKARDRKGELDIHADRLCEWADAQLEKTLAARRAVVALLARNAELEEDAARTPAAQKENDS